MKTEKQQVEKLNSILGLINKASDLALAEVEDGEHLMNPVYRGLQTNAQAVKTRIDNLEAFAKEQVSMADSEAKRVDAAKGEALKKAKADLYGKTPEQLAALIAVYNADPATKPEDKIKVDDKTAKPVLIGMVLRTQGFGPVKTEPGKLEETEGKKTPAGS